MITLAELCPRWSKKLMLPNPQKVSIVDHKRLDIGKEKQCIVGEAYGFSDRFSLPSSKSYCYDCWFCSYLMTHAIVWELDRIEDKVEEFIKHWNTVHSK